MPVKLNSFRSLRALWVLHDRGILAHASSATGLIPPTEVGPLTATNDDTCSATAADVANSTLPTHPPRTYLELSGVWRTYQNFIGSEVKSTTHTQLINHV